MNLNKVKQYSQQFMEREYPDEAPYFHIAWEIFEEVIKDTGSRNLDLEGPQVRFEGNETIMAPEVIRAFYVLFFEIEEKIENEVSSVLKTLVTKTLSQHKFSSEFSVRIADFISGKREKSETT